MNNLGPMKIVLVVQGRSNKLPNLVLVLWKKSYGKACLTVTVVFVDMLLDDISTLHTET